ncbi:MAG: Cell division protein ZapB [Francisellaceae bacterium]|nr:Cell division protein ZapB [Francisellaceae bacterium]
MLNQLLQQLETKIDDAVDNIQLLVLENEELKEKLSAHEALKQKLAAIETDNNFLKTRQVQWEENLAALLQKFNAASIEPNATAPSAAAPRIKEEDLSAVTA